MCFDTILRTLTAGGASLVDQNQLERMTHLINGDNEAVETKISGVFADIALGSAESSVHGAGPRRAGRRANPARAAPAGTTPPNASSPRG